MLSGKAFVLEWEIESSCAVIARTEKTEAEY